MKKFITILTLSILSFSSQAFSNETAQISVNGLVCDFCARALEKTFANEDAVEGITVDLDTKIVSVNFNDGANIDDDRLIYLITDSGYNVEAIERVTTQVKENE